jgi:hypothetical protein
LGVEYSALLKKISNTYQIYSSLLRNAGCFGNQIQIPPKNKGD